LTYLILVLAILRGASGPAAAGDPPPAIDLGVPVTVQNRISYKTAHCFGPAGLDLLCWTTTAESGGYFCAMNLADGKVRVHPLNHLEAYPIVYGSDGKVYTGSTSGEVFCWDPLTDRWGTLGVPLFKYPGASLNHVRALCEGDAGWLYAGSCNGERARVHIGSGTVEKLPAIAEKGNWYVCAVAKLPDGRIAFGCGSKARVFVYDPKLGRDVAQVLPEAWTEDGFCFNLVVGKGVVYATHFPSGRRGVIDAGTGRFIGEIPWPHDSSGHPWSKWVHSSGYGSAVDFYSVAGTDAVVSFDGREIRRFDPRANPAATSCTPAHFSPDPDLALALRYEVTADCRVLEYGPLRRTVLKELRPVLPPVERTVFALGIGPDGSIYGGAYQSTLLFRHNPATGETRLLGDHHPGWSGETFSYAVRGNELICASYTNGAVVGYDPAQPWECGQDAMKNPRFLGFLGQQVYRPLSTCVTEDGKIWSVGPAGWGSSGGGIAMCNPDRNSVETFPLSDVPHSVISLGGQRLLVCSESLLRWWDAATNSVRASSVLPFKSIDACRAGTGSASVMVIADSTTLLMIDVQSPGRYRIMQTVTLPFACVRVLVARDRAILGGEKGFLAVDMGSGVTSHFCRTPLGSRWAFAIDDSWVYFGSRAHLMKTPLP
jgi:hypothetical protein